ncbi:SsgA family sporulation/cell division regulator [Kitasatospora purpeofusca]|uniref:SsgA family sporulation/cell division regulator n=1 Tax=Kitasatospora purpeofusca TaxID=67352 RepID=UPI0035DD48F1
MSAVQPVPVTLPGSPLPDVPVPAELRFDTALPYAVCLCLPLAACGASDDRLGVCWYFSRELLNEGRHAPVGGGDVKVSPGPHGDVRITLLSPAGHAVLSAPADLVTAFLADSYAMVPAGEESDHLDIDTTVTRLLGQG